MERHVEDWVLRIRSGESAAVASLSWVDRLASGLDAVKDIVGKVWPWVVAGVGLGAFIHGYVPTGLLSSFMGKGCLVERASGRASRHPHVRECGGDHSSGLCAP